MFKSYLVHGASILNVLDGKRAVKDILVENGIVSAIEDTIVFPAEEIIDASGLTITPGWVDDHAHFYYDAPDNIGVDPQRYFLPFGVTYAIDPGSAGADNFDDFRKYVRWSTDLKYKSYLNISRIGVPIYGYELTDMSNLDEDACKAAFLRHKDELIGLKVRITNNMCTDPLGALQSVRRMCDELGTHFCVHATRCALSTETILSYLKKGDMLTHSFARTDSGILGEDNAVKNCVWEARRRGVIFDVGHGINSFTFSTAQKAMAQGFQADSLSTDLHISDVNGPVFDMPTTISKFLGLGVSLEEAIRMVTVSPVKRLGLADKSLVVTVGEPADFTAFELKSGTFAYTDCDKAELIGDTRLNSRFTCVGSKIFTPRRSREANRKIGDAATEDRRKAREAFCKTS
ncbi:MAG: amidohydrolase family protein [Oscillospiraceae bacterium]